MFAPAAGWTQLLMNYCKNRHSQDNLRFETEAEINFGEATVDKHWLLCFDFLGTPLIQRKSCRCSCAKRVAGDSYLEGTRDSAAALSTHILRKNPPL